MGAPYSTLDTMLLKLLVLARLHLHQCTYTAA